MTPAELLERVAVRLETTGWQRGHFGGPGGPNCWAGAVSQEAPLFYDSEQVTARLRAREALRHVTGHQCAVTWNDTVCQDQAEAVAMTRRAAQWLADGSDS